MNVPPGMKHNRSPTEDLLSFRAVQIDRRTEDITVQLHGPVGSAPHKACPSPGPLEG